MDWIRVGRAVRAMRYRRGWRQTDLARRAGVSESTIHRVERGDVQHLRLATLTNVLSAAELSMSGQVRWQGGDLERMLSHRHSQMHELMSAQLASVPAWIWASEVSFSYYGERGVIDVLAYHAAAGLVLVIELKTELVDVQELLSTMDRRRRLAVRIARERGWTASQVACWVILAESPTNRRRLASHASVLRHAFPVDGRTMRRWLRHPNGPVMALSFLSNRHPAAISGEISARRRVRKPNPRSESREADAKPTSGERIHGLSDHPARI